MRVVIECLAPLAHGAFGESTGNTTAIRREPLVGLPGRPRVPVISGNALRGTLRRLVMRDLFRRANLSRETLPGRWDRLYAALANGGHLEGEGAPTVRPDEVRALRAALPPLSVFGAALYTWMLPGHMNVGFLWPRCRETLAARLVSEAPDLPAEDLVTEISLCRHVDREEQDSEASGVTPMPTTVEALATGTILESEIQFARSATDVERGAVSLGLQMLRTLGGKSASGFGVVVLGSEYDPGPYLAWLDSTTDLQDRLRALAEQLARTPARAGRGDGSRRSADEEV